MPFYVDGKDPIKVGDQIKLGESLGKIVFVIDDEQFTPEYSRAVWIYLKKENEKGIGILTEKYGLIVTTEPENDLILIKHEN